MPRLLVRQEPPPSEEPMGRSRAETWCDALLVEGHDHAAERRAHIRAMNAARQAVERARGWSARRSGELPAEDDKLSAVGE